MVVVVFEMLVKMDLHFFASVKNIEVEDLVSEFAIEAFDVSMLPWFTWLNEACIMPSGSASALNSGPLSEMIVSGFP